MSCSLTDYVAFVEHLHGVDLLVIDLLNEVDFTERAFTQESVDLEIFRTDDTFIRVRQTVSWCFDSRA